MKVSITILSALSAVALVSAGTFHDLHGSVTTISKGYIIEYYEGIQHTDAYSALKAQSVDYEVRNEFGIFNGAAISVLSDHDGRDIAAIPTIKNVWPIKLYQIPKTKPTTAKDTDPEAVSDHSMTGVDVVHRKLKLTGKGVKVGVIDTGIDYEHPAFAVKGADKGCFGKGCRVEYGWDFVGDAYNGTNTPMPGNNPMDCFGHGTHVAGIVGANALHITVAPEPPQPFVGVAPEATLGAYRVFGCTGSSGDDVIMAAMEKAFYDGMDVINMSLGGGSSYKSNPQAVLGDKLVAKGMALAAAAGNDGGDGVWMVSDTGLGDLSSSVASFDNIYGFYNSFTYAGVAHPYSPSEAWGKPINLPSNATLVPVFNKDGSLSDGCDAAVYSGIDVKGKVVLTLGDITRCKSGGRGVIAQKAGAAGMLTQTTPLGIASLGGNPDFPMGSIENKAGDDLLAAYKKDPKTILTWSKNATNFLIEGGGAPSDFSSFGVDGDLRSKPDYAAPGGNILSTYPLKLGGYALLSGTSMATPYVAGSHALYMQAKNSKPPGDEIRKVLKNTATISKNAGSKTFTSAVKQGGGLINVLNAIMTTSSFSPDHIDLLDTNHLQKTVKLTLKNEGKTAETYTMSHIPADALNSYPKKNTFPLETPLIEADYASVSFSQSKITIPAGKSVQLTVRFSEPNSGERYQFPLYSGFIVATPSSSKDAVAVHVPYIGLKGDVAQVPIMDRDLGFPDLRSLDVASGNLTKFSPNGDVFFDLKTKLPVVQTRMGSHSPSAEIRVYDAQEKLVGFLTTEVGTAVGPIGRQKNVDDDGVLVFTNWFWEGQVMTTANSTKAVTLDSGVYKIVVASQRKLSKGSYPRDYEVFEMGKVKL